MHLAGERVVGSASTADPAGLGAKVHLSCCVILISSRRGATL